MDATIKLEEEEGVGKDEKEKQGGPKGKENFEKKLSKVEARVPTRENKLSTLGPRGQRRLTRGPTISGVKEIKYLKEVPRKSALAQAHHQLSVEGYGLFPDKFIEGGLWKATAGEASNQQLGLLLHGREEDSNIFNLRSAKNIRFGEGEEMSWNALKLAGRGPWKAPNPTFNPFWDKHGDDYPLAR